MPITSEKRLKELPSIYTEIPADQTGKVEPTKDVFDKITKQLLPSEKNYFQNTTKKIILLTLIKNEFR